MLSSRSGVLFYLLKPAGVLTHYGSFAVRTYRNDLDWYSEVLLHECDVLAEFLWKLILCTAVGQVCVPIKIISVGPDREATIMR